MRRWLGPLLFTVVLSAALFSSGTAASAQDDEFATIEIELVGRVPWDERRPVNATVTVKTERAVSGKLSIIDDPSGGTTTTHEYDVDLAANTTATFPITLRTGWEGIEASASISSNGDTVASETIQQFGEGAQEIPLVATLGIDDPPRRIAEQGGDLQLITLPLDRGLRGLESSSSMVATRSALGELGPDSVDLLRVESWVRGGGQLVVDGPTASLDAGYHQFPTANPDRFRFGAGSIVYLDEWEDGIPLGGYLGTSGMQSLVESQNLGYGSSGELAILADIALPAAIVIVGALLIYTFIAGPVVFGLVTARRIQRRIWIILPALSLLFTVGILGIGFSSRRGASEAHITIVEVNERGSRATSSLLLTSNFGDDRRIDAPEGWRYLGQGRSGAQRPARLRVGSTSTEISLNMPPGSNALARVSGPAPKFDGDLTISNLRFVGSDLTGDVTNSGSFDLQEALAFFGNARAEIGAVPAGQTVGFTVAVDDSSGRTMKELLLWPKVRQEWGDSGPLAVPVDRSALTAAGTWTEWRIEQGTSSNPEGVVGVVGWSEEISSPLAGIDKGKTALFVRANVPVGAAEVGFSTTGRLPSRNTEPVFIGNFAGYLEEYRVTLEPGYELDRFAIKLDGRSAGLGLFINGAWQYAAIPDSGSLLINIPEEAVNNGEVLIRSYASDFGRGVGITALMVNDEEGEAEDVVFSTDLNLRNAGGFEGDDRFIEEEEADFFPTTIPVPEPDVPTTTALETSTTAAEGGGTAVETVPPTTVPVTATTAGGDG